jgi:hypothetical protein
MRGTLKTRGDDPHVGHSHEPASTNCSFWNSELRSRVVSMILTESSTEVQAGLGIIRA